MNGSFSILRSLTVSAHPSTASHLVRARRGRRLRRARPLLIPLEERCLLSFGSPSLFDTGANNAAVAIGDIFGDSYDGSPILDLVTATKSGGLSISKGNGDGTFQTPVPVIFNPTTAPTSFSAVKLVDLDGRVRSDGSPILDIVAADPADDELWVLMNDGTGAFATAAYPPTTVALPAYSDPVAMAVAGATPDFINSSTIDFNGDTSTDLLGHKTTHPDPDIVADIVIANPGVNNVNNVNNYNNVIVLLGNGNGTFKAPKVYSVGADPVAVALGDFNNDGYPDIITANEKGNSVSVLLNSGNGTFQPREDIPITVPTPPPTDTVDSEFQNRWAWPSATSTATATSISRRRTAVGPALTSCSGTGMGVSACSRPSAL